MEYSTENDELLQKMRYSREMLSGVKIRPDQVEHLKELTSRHQHEKEILEMVGVLKEIPSLSDIAITEAEIAETNSGLDDVWRSYDELSAADSNVLKFKRTVQNLLPDDLECFACGLIGLCYMKLNRGSVCKFPSRCPVSVKDQKVMDPAPGGGLLMKTATQATAGVLAKVFADKFIGAFDIPTLGEPFVKAASVVGLLLVMSAIVLQDKKPGLSKIMVKFGAMAIAFATLFPMAVSLPPPTDMGFGVLAASVVVVTCALA